MKTVLTVVLLGNLTVTSYRSVPSQTDSSPFHTSTGERTSIIGVAVSRDLLCGACRRLHRRCKHPTYSKKIHYGDILYTEKVGFRVVNDVMGKHKTYRIKTKNGTKKLFKKQEKWIDVFVNKYEDEKYFHKINGIKKHKVWVIKQNEAH